MKNSKPRLVLDQKAEQILRAVYFYRFMGALDVCTLLYSKGALTRVRHTLAGLSGGADYAPREYLYRFQLPGEGNPERIYTLGSRGRRFCFARAGMGARSRAAGQRSRRPSTYSLRLPGRFNTLCFLRCYAATVARSCVGGRKGDGLSQVA
jgi:hypothetical protein